MNIIGNSIIERNSAATWISNILDTMEEARWRGLNCSKDESSKQDLSLATSTYGWCRKQSDGYRELKN